MGIAGAKLKPSKPFSPRRNVNRRILRFSAVIGAIAASLCLAMVIASALPSIENARSINLRTLDDVTCSERGCDSSRLSTDWELSDANYVIDTQTSYVLSVPSTVIGDAARYLPLDYSNTTFIEIFENPASIDAPNGEVWRLYSRSATVNGRKYEIMVGYAEKAAWKMIDSPESLLGLVDKRLKLEADSIAASLVAHKTDFNRVRADGYEVVDSETEKVISWGPWLPIYLPKKVHIPEPGLRPYYYEGELYFTQTDSNGRLTAISLISAGPLSWIAILAGFAFLATTSLAQVIARRYLRNYFAFRGREFPTIDDALRSGECQNVEFKRALSADESQVRQSDDELAESVAAFANTNDGVIFIGIDDNGRLKGLTLNSKQKDRFEQKIRQLVRNRIHPMPPIEVSFEEVSGVTIAKIAVARGDEQAYLMNGVIYVRDGSSDVQAQPEDLKRLVMEFGY